jgi:hypothetical protein
MLDESERVMIADAIGHLFAKVPGDDASSALHAFGAHDLFSDPPEATAILFTEQGRVNARSDLLLALQRSRLPSVTFPIGAVLSGMAPSEMAAVGVLTGRWLELDAMMMTPAPAGKLLGTAMKGASAYVVAVDAKDVDLKPVEGIDPSLPMFRLTGAVEPAFIDDSPEMLAQWEAAIAWTRIALACELVGGSRALLALTTDYAGQRHQFGRPIGSFQAVKHRLAETLVAIEAADAMIASAIEAPGLLSGLLVKSLAGRASRSAAMNCLQVLGGIGFTWEHPFHRFYKRALALDAMFGASHELPSLLGKIVSNAVESEASTLPRVMDL